MFIHTYIHTYIHTCVDCELLVCNVAARQTSTVYKETPCKGQSLTKGNPV